MNKEFCDVEVEELTDAQCRELLLKIRDLVADLPSFIEYDRDRGYGRIYDPYACCSGYTNNGHDKDCGVGQLNEIFGY
jgi:hypothetical protein